MTREEAINVMRGWVLSDKDREALETILPELKKGDRERIKENCIHFLELQKSHHASTIEIDECIDWLNGLVPPKWLYRLEYKDGTCGLWYNGEGKWCFEEGIGSVEGCKTKDLPMDHDERYKQNGRDWFSSCSNKEDLLHWYSLRDAEELLKKGFVFTRYLATEYHEYENETVFIKESALVRKEIDIFELFGKTKPMFKEGDWIIYKDERTREEDILRVSNPDPNGTSLYTVKGEQKYYLAWNSLKDAKLWTNKDAKPGDILSWDNERFTIIFKDIIDGVILAYCSYNDHSKHLETDCRNYEARFISDLLHFQPASRSARRKLFQKIHEEGYMWDAEKKELRKIERNPAWSKEDERRLNNIIKRTIEYGDSSIYGLIKDDIDWLKDIKDRVQSQSKQEWSEEDEGMLKSIKA